MKRILAIAGLTIASALPAWASPYVVCDNGLRCVMAPCPSTNAYDIGNRKLIKGIWIDTAMMAENDRAEIERSEGLYRGTLVISGRIEQRQVKNPAGIRTLPFLVGKAIERKSSSHEKRLCRGS